MEEFKSRFGEMTQGFIETHREVSILNIKCLLQLDTGNYVFLIRKKLLASHISESFLVTLTF